MSMQNEKARNLLQQIPSQNSCQWSLAIESLLSQPSAVRQMLLSLTMQGVCHDGC